MWMEFTSNFPTWGKTIMPSTTVRAPAAAPLLREDNFVSFILDSEISGHVSKQMFHRKHKHARALSLAGCCVGALASPSSPQVSQHQG